MNGHRDGAHSRADADVLYEADAVPGVLAQIGILGAFFAGFGLIGEWREGVIAAERVTPASRTALLVARLYRDLLRLPPGRATRPHTGERAATQQSLMAGVDNKRPRGDVLITARRSHGSALDGQG